MYHQTDKAFTTFDTKQKGSGKFDSEMPTGIFLKPTNNDIGVGGNIQMPLYASVKKPLTVNNRSDLVDFYNKNVQGYKEAKSAINNIDKEYKAKFNEEMKRENEEYQKLWTAKKNGEITEEEYQKSVSRDALDDIMEEWQNKTDEASRKAKSLIDDYFQNSRYDGVIVNNDVGSFGRSTKTFIVFENTQVKSATDNIGTFDKSNSDIRYSLNEDYDFSDQSKLDEEELKIYNNRGWSYGLFNKEDMALLSEKVQELKKGTQKADNALWDGSRLVEVNNKLIILGGTFKNPEIYSVLAINANNETDAEFIKGDFYYDFNRCKRFREVVTNQRYQAILKITDIVKDATSDTEARSELEKAFPQYS